MKKKKKTCDALNLCSIVNGVILHDFFFFEFDLLYVPILSQHSGCLHIQNTPRSSGVESAAHGAPSVGWADML